jgi:hypothetical protein
MSRFEWKDAMGFYLIGVEVGCFFIINHLM